MINISIDPAKFAPEEIAVLLLVLAVNREQEKILKDEIECSGIYKCAITEIGVNIENLKKKLIDAVVGASLDNGIINKTPQHIHALTHAAEEAAKNIINSNVLITNLGVRISIVRDEEWVVVAICGNCGSHHLCNHKHLGMGIMHIC